MKYILAKGVIVCMVVLTAGCALNAEIPKEDSYKSNISNEIELSKLTAPMPIEEVGYINGNEVIVREGPAVSSRNIEVLTNNTKIIIIGEEHCTDEKAVILTVPERVVTYNGRKISLKYGQAMELIEYWGHGLRHSAKCNVKIGNEIATVSVYKDEIREIYGDVWFRIKTPSGKEGFVFGEFIRK